ncbi:MAG: hypothetical protein N3D76_06255 [Geminocystis sp.]|nr:hypothetical protein [Geminocystis sp.]HIK37165.1 hypothetical protein [Geminocystis sp. M7585_C2015_104]
MGLEVFLSVSSPITTQLKRFLPKRSDNFSQPLMGIAVDYVSSQLKTASSSEVVIPNTSCFSWTMGR